LTIIFYFSLDVMAQKDIPSQLQLVANETGKAGEIIYIGHSMGTTLIFMYASEYPEETRELIQGFVTLAPVAYLNGVPLIEVVKPLVLLVIVSTVKYITLTIFSIFFLPFPFHRTGLSGTLRSAFFLFFLCAAGLRGTFAGHPHPPSLLLFSFWTTQHEIQHKHPWEAHPAWDLNPADLAVVSGECRSSFHHPTVSPY
jgi:pimeloyl-ACP methyl ester carboxylesterase